MTAPPSTSASVLLNRLQAKARLRHLQVLVKLAELLNAPMVRSAIVATYMAAMNGMAARKNARTPPAAG